MPQLVVNDTVRLKPTAEERYGFIRIHETYPVWRLESDGQVTLLARHLYPITGTFHAKDLEVRVKGIWEDAEEPPQEEVKSRFEREDVV